MSEPNWEEMQSIAAEALQLSDAAGRLSPSDFHRLLERAKVAVAGHNRLLEFVLNRDPNP